jgi:hypothetical protein
LGGCGPVNVKVRVSSRGRPGRSTGSDPAGRPLRACFGHRQRPQGPRYAPARLSASDQPPPLSHFSSNRHPANPACTRPLARAKGAPSSWIVTPAPRGVTIHDHETTLNRTPVRRRVGRPGGCLCLGCPSAASQRGGSDGNPGWLAGVVRVRSSAAAWSSRVGRTTQ